MKLQTLRKADWFIGVFLAVLLAPITRGLGKILRRDHAFKSTKRIVVMKLLGGGNFALGLPLLLGLRKSFPESELIAVVTSTNRVFAESVGVFDTIHVVQTGSILRLFTSAARCLYSIFKVDVVIDLEIHSKLTTCFGLFTCARNRLGFFTDDFFLREYLYTHLVFFHPGASRPALFNQLALIMQAETATSSECCAHLRRVLSYKATRQGVVGVGVGCSDLGLVRKLSAEQWQMALGRALREQGATEVVFLGSKDDRQLADEVISGLVSRFTDLSFTNRCGDCSLQESLGILSECSYYLGVDSALLHFARLMYVPSESFWGPTDPETLLLPIDNYSEKVHYRPLICSPCIHVAETAPCKGRNLCIKSLFSEQEISPSDALRNTTIEPSDKAALNSSL
jgi:ADP-heptose:LPS heptosyltransferase